MNDIHTIIEELAERFDLETALESPDFGMPFDDSYMEFADDD